MLHWESPGPEAEAGLAQGPEYRVERMVAREAVTEYRPGRGGRKLGGRPTVESELSVVRPDGRYSTLLLDFVLRRETGQYIIGKLLLLFGVWVFPHQCQAQVNFPC